MSQFPENCFIGQMYLRKHYMFGKYKLIWQIYFYLKNVIALLEVEAQYCFVLVNRITDLD